MTGVLALCQTIAARIANLCGHTYNADHEIIITADATQALLTIILCCIHPGDEVIVFKPAYDSYILSIELMGGRVVPITLNAPDFHIPFNMLTTTITWHTHLVMLSTPYNPTGTVRHADDMRKFTEILAPINALLLSDKVYEHMVYDGVLHTLVARTPELTHRTFVVSSFDRTYHVTDWKVGYMAAPAALMAKSRKVYQFNVSTINTPVQHSLANYVADPCPYLELSTFCQRKRDLFHAGLENMRFKFLPCQGAYFQYVDHSAIFDLSEARLARWLTSEIGVAVVPVLAFYSQSHESGVTRFCFAKKDGTFQVALECSLKV